MIIHRQITRIFTKYYSSVNAFSLAVGKSNLHIE